MLSRNLIALQKQLLLVAAFNVRTILAEVDSATLGLQMHCLVCSGVLSMS